MDAVATLLGHEPLRWHVVFHRRSAAEWLQRLVPGRYKHVSAFGFVPELDAWVFINARMGRLVVSLSRSGDQWARAVAVVMDGDQNAVLKMPLLDPGAAEPLRLRPAFSCVSVVAHLLGLRSWAVTPDGLMRVCLAKGGQLVVGRSPS